MSLSDQRVFSAVLGIELLEVQGIIELSILPRSVRIEQHWAMSEIRQLLRIILGSPASARRLSTPRGSQ